MALAFRLCVRHSSATGVPACHCWRMLSFCCVETRLRRPRLTGGSGFICIRLFRPFKLSKSQLGQTSYLISNYHVVKAATKVCLVTSTGTVDAKVVQVD